MAQHSPPSITETAFDCPHCGAFTTQYWFDLHAGRLGEKQRTPQFPGDAERQDVLRDKQLDFELKQSLLDWIESVENGLVFLPEKSRSEYTSYLQVGNLFLSRCYNCKKVAVWVHQNLVFPSERLGAQPNPDNPDLPETVLHDFEEARAILNFSPRGAAARLRLCLQKLCLFFGEKGQSIDDDIASLVAKGLSPLVQKALDVVRVIGNEAVHPGTIDLKGRPGYGVASS